MSLFSCFWFVCFLSCSLFWEDLQHPKDETMLVNTRDIRAEIRIWQRSYHHQLKDFLQAFSLGCIVISSKMLPVQPPLNSAECKFINSCILTMAFCHHVTLKTFSGFEIFFKRSKIMHYISGSTGHYTSVFFTIPAPWKINSADKVLGLTTSNREILISYFQTRFPWASKTLLVITASLLDQFNDSSLTQSWEHGQNSTARKKMLYTENCCFWRQ